MGSGQQNDCMNADHSNTVDGIVTAKTVEHASEEYHAGKWAREKSGHLGYHGTVQWARDRGLHLPANLVKEVIRKCEICQKAKHALLPTKPMAQIKQRDQLAQIWQIDYVGPLLKFQIKIVCNVFCLIFLQVPTLCEDLLSSVDQPLKIARDKVIGKDYLLCDYNRDGDSYRSPWSNKYDPPLEDGAMPSARLRKLEVEANKAFDQYRDLYFEGGVSSVYLWDLDHGFAGVILIKKAGDGSKKIKGCWDSIHVVEVQEKSSGRTAHYKLTSTVMLWLQTNKAGSGTMNLGGSLTRQVQRPENFEDENSSLHSIEMFG
ncbi:F-actin-capping protein subunit beta [Rhincodon typus]|uniref:F-actin-capping protein subunit beta n=1 Tax=Rhincodon typus TaxID=259920 RepID=UPI0020309E45|nr:F-actin-capping protein subunit beta [Rhincodon typus]